MIRFFRHMAVKVVMIIMLLFSFLVVDTKNKVEAFAPLVPVLVSVGTYLAKEVAFELGWKAGKKGVEYMTKKLAPKIEKGIKNKEFDWVKSKPTKKGKKMRVPVSGKDVAKMAWHLSDIGEEVITESVGRPAYTGEPYQGGKITTDNVDPFYNTAVNVRIERGSHTMPAAFAFPDYFSMAFHLQFTPLPYEGKSKLQLISSFNTSKTSSAVILSGGNYIISFEDADDKNFRYYSNYIRIRNADTGEFVTGYRGAKSVFYSSAYSIDDEGVWAFDMYRDALAKANTKYHFAQGLAVPEDMREIVKLPPNTPNSYDLDKEFAGKVIDIDLGVDLDFDLPDNYDTEVLLETVIQQNPDFDFENHITNNVINNIHNDNSITTHNTYITNNNYYDNSKAEDIIKEVLPLLPKPVEPTVPDDKPPITGEIIPVDPIPKLPIEIGVEVEGMKYCVNGDEVVPCKDIEAIDGSLLAMAKNSYKYATDTIKTGVEGIQSLGSSATEMTKLFDTFFGWLPSEIRVLMVGGFSLVIGIGLFRAFRR